MNTDYLDKYCEETFGHTDWEQETDESGDVVIRFKKPEQPEDPPNDPSFPWSDMWGSITVDHDFPGMHPDKLVDFHIYEEDDASKHISFYGWDEKYEQTDTSNCIGSYELVKWEDK